MIDVTKLNGKSFVLNAWHIEHVEATPDTVITLTTGRKYIVKEQVDVVVSKAKAFFRETSIFHPVPLKKEGVEDEG